MNLKIKVGLFVLFTANLFSQVGNPIGKPNILCIVMEDTSPNFIGCYGDSKAKTPNIDKLASQGVRFTNAFATGTVCSPSRTCLITGVKTYETGTGNHRIKFPLPSTIKGFPKYLRDAGYYTSNNAKTDYNITNEGPFKAEAWNIFSSRDGDGGWEGRSTVDKSKPFFAVVNFDESHQIHTMVESYSAYTTNIWNKLLISERTIDSGLDMPPFYRDSHEMEKNFARVYNSITLADKEIGKILAKLEADGLKDDTIIFFYSDHGQGIPRVKTNGIGLGYRIPFIVYFPEKFKSLSPWGEAGAVTDELLDFNDLAPTMISLAGGTVPSYMKGRILIGPNRNASATHLFLSTDRSDNGIDMVRTVTNGRYVYSRNFMPFMPELRYINYAESSDIKKQMRTDFVENKLNDVQNRLFLDRPGEYLFDTQTDPWEINNLANNPAYSVILGDMGTKLENEILTSRDIMFLPEYSLLSISTTNNPYQYRQSDTNYPIAAIYGAAKLSGIRGTTTTTSQIGLLDSSNDIVRYWAITGLRSQSDADLVPYSSTIISKIGDDYAPVAITASAVAYNQFESTAAKTKLLDNCKTSSNEVLALMTVNHLLYVRNKQPFKANVDALLAKAPAIGGDLRAACLDFLSALTQDTLKNTDWDSKNVNAIQLYPNPISKGILNISSSSSHDFVAISFYDLSGKLALKQELKSLPHQSVSLANIKTKGNYVVTIETKSGIYSKILQIN